MIEDTYFNYTLLSYINKIVYLEDYVGYIRHVQYDSMTHSSNYDRVKEIINNAFDLHSIYKKNRKDVDISWLIAPFLDASLLYIYSSDIINDKKKVYDLLNDIYALEKETNFNESYLNISLKTANKLIMKKQFKLAIVNLKLLRKLYGNESFMKVYRKITYPS